MIGFADRVDSASSPDTNGTSVIGFADQVVWNCNDSQTKNVIGSADQVDFRSSPEVKPQPCTETIRKMQCTLQDVSATELPTIGDGDIRSIPSIIHLDMALGMTIRARGLCYVHNFKRRAQRLYLTSEAREAWMLM